MMSLEYFDFLWWQLLLAMGGINVFASKRKKFVWESVGVCMGTLKRERGVVSVTVIWAAAGYDISNRSR